MASQRELSSTETLPGLSEITLTPEGWEYACKIVRNHRLWELYLTNEAEYDDDHVHEDAEKIEHLLRKNDPAPRANSLKPSNRSPRKIDSKHMRYGEWLDRKRRIHFSIKIVELSFEL